MWATPQDVQDAWIGDDSPSDAVKLQTWIDKAERLIRQKVPGVQVRVDSGEADLAENLRDVVVDMVTRVFRNPENVRTRSITTGPFSENSTYGGDTPGGLALLPEELEKIAGTARSRRAFSVDMIPPSSPFYGAAPAPGTWEPLL